MMTATVIFCLVLHCSVLVSFHFGIGFIKSCVGVLNLVLVPVVLCWWAKYHVEYCQIGMLNKDLS